MVAHRWSPSIIIFVQMFCKPFVSFSISFTIMQYFVSLYHIKSQQNILKCVFVRNCEKLYSLCTFGSHCDSPPINTYNYFINETKPGEGRRPTDPSITTAQDSQTKLLCIIIKTYLNKQQPKIRCWLH